MGEDVDEEKGAKQESPKGKTKKRKAQKQPAAQPKGKKKATKPSPTKPTTRVDTRATTQVEKEKEKQKAKKQGGPTEKKKRRNYVAPTESDEERTQPNEDQFRLVSHSTTSKLESVCNNIRDNVDLTSLKTIEFNELSKEQKNIEEESIYTMMAKFKTTPLELDNSIPKELSSIVENKWHKTQWKSPSTL